MEKHQAIDELLKISKRKKRMAFVVIGCHGSGASPLARVLHLMGVELANDVVQPHAPQARPAFGESVGIRKISDRLLKAAGSSWDDILEFPIEFFQSQQAAEFRERVLEYLVANFVDSSLFLVKDSRISRLLPLWTTIFEEFHCDSHFIIPVRAPMEFAAAMRRRHHFAYPKSIQLWLRHILDAEKYTRSRNRSFIAYDDLLHDWISCLNKISNDSGVAFAMPTGITAFKVTDYLLGVTENRYPGLPAQYEGGERGLELARTVYEATLAQARFHQSPCNGPHVATILDGVQERIRTAEEILGPAIWSLALERDRQKRLRKSVEARVSGLRSAICKLEQAAEGYCREVERSEREVVCGFSEAPISASERTKLASIHERTMLELAQTKQELDQTRKQLQATLCSRSWRLTAPLRLVGQVVRASRNFARRESKRIAHRIWSILTSNGRRAPDSSMRHAVSPVVAEDPYAVWLEMNQWNNRSEQCLRQRLKDSSNSLPSFSVVMPVYNTPLDVLKRATSSVLTQIYDHWEFCIADDASKDRRVTGFLQQLQASDPRVHVIVREKNGGISDATNTAAAVASGDFLVFLDHDDALSKNALAEMALFLADHPNTDYLYTDQDRIDANGKRHSPKFKPDWSPELLLSYMYCSHAICVRRTLFMELGGMRKLYDGSQDYDFALRATERARHVGHIPLVLYHQGIIPGSTALSAREKPYSFEAGRRAVESALIRRGIEATVTHPTWAAKAGRGVYAHEFSDKGPLVSVIIPTRNRVDLLRRCISSVAFTTYQNYEIVIVDNESDDPETLEFLKSAKARVLRIASPANQFNFSFINNRAVEMLKAEYVLFLNNDTEVIEPAWLSRMMGFAQMPGVGAVGARLEYPDGRIQHAGILHGLSFPCYPATAFKGINGNSGGYLDYATVVRNYSAVTAACMLTPRKLFLQLGGFDEENFPESYNDVDYCLRLADAGLRCVYQPGAKLIHYEGSSRGAPLPFKELVSYRKKYKNRREPFYNPNLSRECSIQPGSNRLGNEQFRVKPRRLVSARDIEVKTLAFSHNLNLEGAPQSMLELMVGLRDRLYVQPVVISPTDGPLRERYQSAGIPVKIVPGLQGAKQHSMRGYSKCVEQLIELIRQEGFHAVYANTVLTFSAIDAAAMTRTPSIWNIRESERYDSWLEALGFDREVARRAQQCFRFPYRVVFVAQATMDMWRPLESRHNFQTIHNALSPDREKWLSASRTREAAREMLHVLNPDEIVVVCLGTVCERKGQLDLPAALNLLRKETLTRVRCYIVGARWDMPYCQELLKQIAGSSNDLARRIEVVPECSDVSHYLQAADIFVCTSRGESFPRVILEAMAVGLPIITTPVFGIKEQVINGGNAMFYEPGRLSELADLLATLIEDNARRRAMAENSRSLYSAMSSYWEMVDSYGNLFVEAYFTGNGP